jgi:hypothetical protein
LFPLKLRLTAHGVCGRSDRRAYFVHSRKETAMNSEEADAKETQDNKTKLESLGYRTAHLSPSDIDELIRLIEQKRPERHWRSKL